MKNHDRKNKCQIHEVPSSAGNKALISMVLVSFALVAWHVWVYGPTSQPARPDTYRSSFFVLLGIEIWDLIFSKSGIIAELKDIVLYFLFGILLAGFIRTYKLAIKLRNSLIRYNLLSIFMASFVGILTPLCACGILTTVITLLFAGLPLATAMALLVSSPLISPSAYLLTLNDLGPQWTVIRVAASFLMGIFAGVLTHSIRNKGFQTGALFVEGAIHEGNFHDQNYPDERLRCNCKKKFGNRVAARTENKFIIFLAKSSDMLWLVGKYLLVGIAIGTIVNRYVPSEWIYSLFGREDSLNIIWITIGAIPVFLHQISASSILYNVKNTLDGTLNGGAGLAFLIGGPVTAIPTMVMLWAMFKKRVFFLYMFISIFGTILLAYSFQYFVFTPYVDIDNPLLKDVSSISGGSSTVISKTGRNIRIVIDPGGKGMIAVYDGYMEGEGIVVFDAGFERFLDISAEMYDNRKYIHNIAERLEDNNSSANERTILIYDTFHNSGFDKNSFNKSVPIILRKKGEFKVKLTDRKETPEITEQLLDSYSQLWIYFGESGSKEYFSKAELETIYRFVEGGRGMLIVTGKHTDGVENYWAAANQISSRFGVQFSGITENKEELRVSTLYNFFYRMSEILERVYRLMT
jgi:uncharacterized membrane protein YraQ (UPF0718 family)